MKPLRFIAATFVAVLCAFALSVGAAMAEGPHTAAKPATASKSAPALLCDLHDVPR
jgi:hypothetical protein